jgi:NAD dependent epimerase/dehydratase family enzyme
MFVGGPIGSGRQGFSWIHLDDEIAALLRCIDEPKLRGAVNLCAPEPVSNAELSRLIGELLKRPAIVRAPGFALRALFGEGAEPLLGGQWGVPRRLQQVGFEFRYSDIRSTLRAVLGRGS